MNKIKIGILGTANIATRSVIPEIIKLDDKFKLVGIASRRIEKSREVSKKFNTKAYGSYNDLIDSNLIDALYIPLPNALHYQYAQSALSQGIHVLMEKSLGCTYDEVKELVELAESKNLLLMENFQFRFHSQLDFLENFIKSKEIGEIRAVIAAFCFPPFSDNDNIRYQKELGGGALLDAGAYTTKISTLLLGSNLKVTAATLNSDAQYGVDIWGSAFLEDKRTGVNVTCIFGFDNFYQCGVQVIGSKGKITTNRLFTAKENHPPIFDLEINGEEKKSITLPTDNHFKNMLNNFYSFSKDDSAKEKENRQNLIQAELIQNIKIKAYEQ